MGTYRIICQKEKISRPPTGAYRITEQSENIIKIYRKVDQSERMPTGTKGLQTNQKEQHADLQDYRPIRENSKRTCKIIDQSKRTPWELTRQ